MEYDDETGAYVVPDVFEAPGELHATVVTTVAAATGTDAASLESLYERVDPDGLETVFEPHRDGRRRSGGVLRFPLGGAVVTLHSEGELRVETD
jgi:hypothetical protein